MVRVTEDRGSLERAILERIGPVSAKELINLSSNDLEQLEKKVIKVFPNNYTFTKLLAETVLTDWIKSQHEIGNRISLNIVRPTVISPAIQYPFPGFVSSSDGICGAIGMYLRGLLRRVSYSTDHVLDIVPVDSVANTVILACMLSHNLQSKYIVHIGSTARGGVLLRKILDATYEISMEHYPFNGAKMISEDPALSGGLDALERPMKEDLGSQDMRRNILMSKKVNKCISNKFSFFLRNSWIFDDRQLRLLQNAVPTEIKDMFPTDLYIHEEEKSGYLKNFNIGIMKTFEEE